MIPVSNPHVSKKALAYVRRCFAVNWFSQGMFNRRLEEAFAKRFGSRYATSCSNGSIALWLALKACSIGAGDEVIVPTFTFSATTTAVIHAGAIPVFVDSEPRSYALDPDAVERAVTKKTKAIIVVHLYGLAADMGTLMRIARKHHLRVIEDAAEGLGGSYKGKALGTIGDIGCFSFFANKVLTTGEGGMCVTNSKRLYERLILFKNHGTAAGHVYWSDVVGFNGRMTNLQAAIGLSQLEDFDRNLRHRYEVFERYARNLADTPGIITLPYEKRTYSPWMFTLRIPSAKKGTICEELKRRGIEARPAFYPCHSMPVFRRYVRKGQRFPIASSHSREMINLPTYPDLSKRDIDAVCNALRAVLR
ncbi:MAG TPA: DegT/DnrJ/EryC1/StrS family aminotransferase [Candidatus Paceibacterota bacterium]|nr:DegT/DnrJ/EryC1/StrS family aminotransferase [Candidatus Paceibacterota bacterium]